MYSPSVMAPGIVSPAHRKAISLPPALICSQDGSEKHDGARTAARRWITGTEGHTLTSFSNKKWASLKAPGLLMTLVSSDSLASRFPEGGCSWDDLPDRHARTQSVPPPACQ